VFILFDGSVLENSSITGLSARNASSVTLSGPSATQPGAVRGNGSPLKPTTMAGGAKTSISCDGSSLVAGDLSGLSDVSCKVEKK
jgi:hypothetical protein